MGIREIERQLEARLTGQPYSFFSRPLAKIERTSYGDGGEKLEIRVRNIKAPDAATVVAKAGSVELARMSLAKGRARYEFESQNPADFPPLEANQTIEIEVNGECLLSGSLYVD